MKEKLIIKNFGPIKDVELELGKFNVLIGEQATGKSTVAKLLAVCRYFSYIMQGDSILNNYFEQGIQLWGLSEFVKDGSFIKYQCYHYIFSVTIFLRRDYNHLGEVDGSYYDFVTEIKSHSEEFGNLLEEFKKINPNAKEGYGYHEANWKPPTSFFINDVSRVMDNPLYLPTERGLQSIFSLGKASIQNISDSLFNQFAKLDQISRSFKEETLIEPLEIIYKNVDGRGYVKKKNEKNFYSLFNGASGFQSTIPNVLAIKYYTEKRLGKKSKTFIIEEPELNLFPSAQAELMKFFAENLKYHNQILLTTHSPYILTSLNNLMYAYQVGQNHTEDVAEIINEKYWINPKDVSAYRLMKDGTVKNILDEKLKQIDAAEVDEISRTINDEWDRISDIKFSAVNEH